MLEKYNALDSDLRDYWGVLAAVLFKVTYMSPCRKAWSSRSGGVAWVEHMVKMVEGVSEEGAGSWQSWVVMEMGWVGSAIEINWFINCNRK